MNFELTKHGEKALVLTVEAGLDTVKLVDSKLYVLTVMLYNDEKITDEEFRQVITNINILSGGKYSTNILEA